MFWKKNNKKNKKDELIEQHELQYKVLDDRLDKLERIVKYARPDRPTYYMRTYRVPTFGSEGGFVSISRWGIYIYNDMRELNYVTLPELDGERVLKDETAFRMDDNIVYLSVTTSNPDNRSVTIHEFVINWKTGKEVCTSSKYVSLEEKIYEA